MTDATLPDDLDSFRERLATLAHTAPPKLRDLARFMADRPEEMAFHSVRSLAELAGSNPNTVVRLAQSLGYSGYDEARGAVQQALRQPGHAYAERAHALANLPLSRVLDELHAGALANTGQVFDPRTRAAIAEVVPHLLSARRVHCIGVRMGYALAHYFTYRGGVAHANILPAPAQPGLMLDALTEAGPEDIVIVISFAHYSTEVLRAAQVARTLGARLMAITDSLASPLAQSAWRVFCPPLLGPNLMYPMSGAFLMIEAMLETMAAQDPQAQGRIERFEERLIKVGAYLPG